MLPDEAIKCHRTGFQKSCFECVTKYKCQLWMHLQMIHPQSGQQIDKWGCKDSLELILTVDLGKKLNEVSASVDSFRNQSLQIETSKQVNQVEAIAEVIKPFIAPPQAQRLLDAKD